MATRPTNRRTSAASPWQLTRAARPAWTGAGGKPDLAMSEAVRHHRTHAVPPDAGAVLEKQGMLLVSTFMAVALAGSFRAAQRETGFGFRTVQRRVEQLEALLGCPLFRRGKSGLVLTCEGERVLVHARGMSDALRNIGRVGSDDEDSLSGSVAISVTEGLGTFWIVPRLGDLLTRYPQLDLTVVTSMRVNDLADRSMDVSIQLAAPRRTDIECSRLGTLHALPVASRRYLETHGVPTNIIELADHRLVLKEDEQISDRRYFEEHVPELGRPLRALSTSTSSAHYWAIARHLGIGLFPTYAKAIGARVEALNLPLRTSYPIWLCHRAEATSVPRIRAVVDWLRAAFDPEVYPWFRDEFVHPDDLERYWTDETMRGLFDSIIGKPA
jgi:DNA-binding transcriptional LysR family regulator